MCEPEAKWERDNQSYGIAGGRCGSKLLLFGRNVLYFQHKLNYIDVDDSVSFHNLFEKISIFRPALFQSINLSLCLPSWLHCQAGDLLPYTDSGFTDSCLNVIINKSFRLFYRKIA